MSLTCNSLCGPPTNVSLQKLCPKPRVSLFPNHRESNNPPRSSGKMACLDNSFLNLTSPSRPLQLDLPNHGVDVDADDNRGIGILKFFAGTNIFITGATGLVGKVIVEKLLRSTQVGKVYMLIKAEDIDAAFDRLAKEIIRSDLLKNLKDVHGKTYEAFVREKLIPVVGNICEPNLGMDCDSMDAIRNDVDVIIVSAAGTTLNERYDKLLELNAVAPLRLMKFAKTCKNLKLFAHISTAYVNGKREGMILEQPLIMGENRRKVDDDIPPSFPRLDLADEIQVAFKSSVATSDYEATKNLKRLGLERADFFGWNNTYHLTKAMGEMALNEITEGIPLLIIRPTVIESSYKEPFPGWIQGNRMFDPVIISYGKGQLPAFFGDPEVVMDIIPIDIVANATIAAVAKHGAIHEPETNVYHVSSSAVNPLKFSEFFEFLYQYFNTRPLVKDESIEKIKYFGNFKEFSKYTREEMSRRSKLKHPVVANDWMDRKAQSRCKAKVMYAEQLCKMYEFLGFSRVRFHSGNTQKLLQEMSEEEQLNFEVDVLKINWSKYLQEIHIPGLRKHVLDGKRKPL